MRLRLLLLVGLLVFAPSVVNRLHDFLATDGSFFLSLLQSLSAPLQAPSGFLC